MSASSSKGVKVCMTTVAADGTLTATAITAAKPAALTGTGYTVQPGDMIHIEKTGNAKLDGKWWIVDVGATATNIPLVGSDNTGGTTTVDPAAVIKTRTGVGSMVCLCLSNFAIQRDAPGTISVATFCDPGASLPVPTTQAGTVTIGGYVDISADDFKAIVAAEEDAKSRTFRVTLPGNGYIVFEGVVSGFTYDIPLDGALGWSATVTLTATPRHLF